MRFLSAKSVPAGAGSPGRGVGEGCDAAARTLLKGLDALGGLKQLDKVTGPLQKAVRALPLGPYRAVLQGRPIGHPLHPVLVQVPIGAWTSAAVLDLLPGGGRHARLLVGMGVVSALPATWAGWVDWAEQPERQLRTGVVHAASNGVAIGLYAGSWVVRGRGRPLLGRVLGFAGLTLASVGGMIGGHLAYRQGVGANKTEPVDHLVEPGWHPVGRAAEFTEGQGVRRMLGEVPLLVVREADGAFRVLVDRCSHMAGPLSQGKVADGCVECPWHGSVFRLADGENVGGPATAPQPTFETRLTDNGVLEVRLPGAV
ncbi:Anthranilate 1,2-dioxygenase ferredoxin subunit [Streptomyces hundungensis]|uniref:Anthranilate 1,2-dioxygenase ferredoxin subunit n=1 Tax=Streptomyces hundungensis TaxID=1077946 RepID=A0A387HDQ4_9ACTN|nr:Rieske 2Fe-2S domain-containing protein [Streptomyces hundungensis]AYG78837.1 Anthranilate 1,2-dioxygenase ferredoxin subunit [Streptomyces hundungensis]